MRGSSPHGTLQTDVSVISAIYPKPGAVLVRFLSLRLSVVCCVVLFSACATNNAAQSASSSLAVAELQALDAQQSWDELLMRAKSVSPTQRDAAWNTCVEHAAVGQLQKKKVANEDDARVALQTVESLMEQFPSLQKSPSFLSKRADVGVSSFRYTLRSSNTSEAREWVQTMVSFAESDTVTAALPQRLANEVVLKRLVGVTAFPLFSMAFRRDNVKVCDDPGLPATVTSALEYESYGEEVSDIVKKKCSARLKPLLVDAALKSDDRKLMAGVCGLMKGDAAAEKTLKAKCER
jgi:hypothetical protein